MFTTDTTFNRPRGKAAKQIAKLQARRGELRARVRDASAAARAADQQAEQAEHHRRQAAGRAIALDEAGSDAEATKAAEAAAAQAQAATAHERELVDAIDALDRELVAYAARHEDDLLHELEAEHARHRADAEQALAAVELAAAGYKAVTGRALALIAATRPGDTGGLADPDALRDLARAAATARARGLPPLMRSTQVDGTLAPTDLTALGRAA